MLPKSTCLIAKGCPVFVCRMWQRRVTRLQDAGCGAVAEQVCDGGSNGNSDWWAGVCHSIDATVFTFFQAYSMPSAKSKRTLVNCSLKQITPSSSRLDALGSRYCEVALAEAHIKTRLDPVYTLAFLQVMNACTCVPQSVQLSNLQSDNDRVDALYNIRTQHDVKAGIPAILFCDCVFLSRLHFSQLRLDRRDGYIAVEGAPSDVEASVAKISKVELTPCPFCIASNNQHHTFCHILTMLTRLFSAFA